MRGLKYLMLLAGVVYSVAAFSLNVAPSFGNAQGIDGLVEKVYKIPYPDIVCAFSNLNRGAPGYVDRKFSDKKVRERVYRTTFGDVFSSALLRKFERQCVHTSWTGLKPDFRTADQDTEDDYLKNHAPVLKMKAKPVIIQRNATQARVKILWKQVYTEGKNKQITEGRTDLILVLEHGLWRIDDAIANPSSEVDDDSAEEFDKSIGLSRLRD